VFGTPFPTRIGSVAIVVVLGAICFAAMGIGLSGLIRSGEGSSAVVNLIVLPMSFLTGAFGPTHHYPRFLRATPLPPVTYVSALLASTIVVFALESVALFVLGRLVFGTPFPTRIGSVAIVVVLGAICFAAMGIGLSGLIRSGEGSSAVVNLIVLPMSFLTGAFGPTHHYPRFLRAIGDALPLKYLVDLSNAVYLHKHSVWSKPGAIGILLAWGVAGVVVAAFKFRWEPREG
ncbi:MAG TPA: ABC transporter permease, partial [Gaiellaceae bacterium]|nr:ABC transporter permease [Gaiellaceae bacterium]